MTNTRTVCSDESAEESEQERGFLYIKSICIVNDYIVVKAYSDMKILDLYLNERLCCRQQREGMDFEFFLPTDSCLGAEMFLAAKSDPKIFKRMKLDL